MPRSSVASSTPEPGEPDRPPPRLVLASEALREDVAPKHPGAKRGRLSLAAASVTFAGFALALAHGIPLPSGASGGVLLSAGAAVATGSLACLPIAYGARAVGAALLGVTVLLLGLGGFGPAGALSAGDPSVTEALALGLLPGALLFRAQYRAYRRARGVLALALFATAPFALEQALIVAAGTTPLVTRGVALLNIAVVLSGLFGFMGEDTTAGGSVWAALVLTVLPAGHGLRALDTAHHHAHGTLAFTHGLAAQVVSTAGIWGVGVVVAVGSYHSLSAFLGADARRAAKAKAREEGTAPPSSPAASMATAESDAPARKPA